MDSLHPNRPDHPANDIPDAAYPMSDYQPHNNANMGASSPLTDIPLLPYPQSGFVPHNYSTSPPLASNDIPDAAYPTSDYQPHNNANASSSSSSSAPPRQSLSGPLQGLSNPSSRNEKFTEIAQPSLATTTGRDQAQRRQWEEAGPSHMSLGFEPPPSYEQSQSHTQSRPGTGSQAGSSRTGPSVATTASGLNNGQRAGALNTPTSPSSVTSSSPNRPQNAYQPASRTSFNGPNSMPSLLPPATRPQVSTSSSSLPSPLFKQDRPALDLAYIRKRRKRKWWSVCFALVLVFIIALFVGLYIGIKEARNNNSPDDEGGLSFGDSPRVTNPNRVFESPQTETLTVTAVVEASTSTSTPTVVEVDVIEVSDSDGPGQATGSDQDFPDDAFVPVSTNDDSDPAIVPARQILDNPGA